MFASPALVQNSAVFAPLPRRVTYIIPAPTSSPPLLSLPPVDVDRRGHTAPLYTRAPTGLRNAPSTGRPFRSSPHPRHRLAVQALALDLSTAVSRSNDSGEPGGILYTGARDGLLCSWELDLPVKKRRKRYGQPTVDPEDDDYDQLGGGSDDDVEAERRDPTESEENGILDLDDLDSLNRSVSVQEAQKRARSDSFRRGSYTSASAAREAKGSAENGVNEALPVEERWEIDDERLNSNPRSSRFRQCIQSHTDWVNDIVLCNSNRTLVSASSDSLVLAWNPHASSRQAQVTPQQIGKHTDYVRCLTSARGAGWVASGGFDRKINLWDLGEGREKPIIDLTPPASVYSLSSTPSGSLLAAGTPERVVRVWDPRSRSQVARLGGHTDNVRAVLLAEEGKWLLSASSDSTVKLWSLAAQKCLHTFSHHSESVWALFSQHASLEIFYSGDRVGNLCKIDLQGTGEPGEGECVLLARDYCEDDSRPGSQGISQIVAQDDAYVWTAGSSSTVKRWRDCPPRLRRAGAITTRREGMASVVSLSAPLEEVDSNDRPMTPPRPESPPDGRERSAVVSFAESLTSGLTRTVSSPTSPTGASGSQVLAHRPSSLRARVVPSANSARRPSLIGNTTGSSSQRLFDIHYDSLIPLTSPEASYFSSAFLNRARDPDAATIYSVTSGPSQSIGSRIAASTPPPTYHISRSLSEVTRENNLARREYIDREDCSEAAPLRSSPDGVIEGGQGLTRCELLNDRRHALTIDTEDEVALWDIVRCECLGVFEPQEVHQLRRRPSDAFSNMSGSSSPVSEAVSSADLLDLVRERIEGEGAVATWCKCDARTGSLVVHLEEARVFDGEVYADEAMPTSVDMDPGPEHRIILGKWVLRNLFDSFIEAEMELRAGSRTPVPHSRRVNGVPNFISLSGLATAVTPGAMGLKTPGMTIALATPALNPVVLPPNAPSFASSSPVAVRSHDLETIPQSPTPHVFDAGDFARNSVTPGLIKTPAANGRVDNDYFSLPTSPNDSTTASPVISSPSGPLPTPGGSLMGRLRNLGKASKKANVESTEAPAATSVPLEPETIDTRSAAEQHQHQVLQTVFSRPLAHCEPEDAPTLTYPSDTAIIISEGGFDSSASSVIYRGLVGTGREDLSVLEQKAPLWLLDFLLGNRVLIKEPVKLSFLIQPWTDENGKSDLRELPNSNARLTANRTLRLRKVVGFVADKLNLGSVGGRTSISSSNDSSDPTTTTTTTPTPASSSDNAPEPPSEASAPFDPEKELEILVGGVVLPGWSTIASARTFYWKNGGDLVLHYRFKRNTTV
ncbi:BQ2448_2968 [Microbotryum intermedium]|uniref:BQ2448_2968 protein n=1 Tax=Microbotryum intermedium TaxID=269621 RepID=A0A238FC14_9BASI|nr:BQ2448_2968 [Microbotryum intermedium]